MKMTMFRSLVVGVLLTGCASRGMVASTAGGGRDPNVITAAELSTENSPNVYDAIQHLRPEMLRPHLANASSSINAPGDYTIKVYIDNSKFGEVSDLRTIPISTVKEIRYLNPSQAMQRFGSGNPGGVIQLISR